MKIGQKLTLGLVLLAILVGSFNSIVVADEEIEGEEFEGHEFLFMMEEAYTQERDEWQISFASQYMERQISKEGDEVKQRNDWQWVTEIEYGISEWFQIEIEIPFAHVHKKTTEDDEVTHLSETGLGDVETGIRVRLFEEDEDEWWSHTVSAGIEVAWPTGYWKKDLGTDRFGWETGLSISKTLEKWAYHLAGGFGMINDAREQGESSTSDVTEVELAAAVVHSPTDELDLICELTAEFEREKSSGSEGHETELYVTPGVQYELFEDVETGVGVPIGLTNDSYDWGIIAKIQIEW